MNIKGTHTPLGNKEINSLPIAKYVPEGHTAMYRNNYDYWMRRIGHEPTCKLLARAGCSGHSQLYDGMKAKVQKGWRYEET